MLIRHGDFTVPLLAHPMTDGELAHPRVRLTSRHIELDGAPVVPISGEMHYSRVPRAQWRERLELMVSGGVTVLSAYIIWLHHEEIEGEISFEGNLDVAAFLTVAAEVGLDIVLRIGPWCHGEVRNGGFPDWVQAAPVKHRTNHPGYLDLVRPWFAALGEQLAPLCGPGSSVVAVQVDNELYDQPDHLLTIKQLAQRSGIVAPLWTATAWGGAQLPADELLPLFGGYADGFWVDADQPWDATFRSHFFFSRTWDDPGIGADIRGELVTASEPGSDARFRGVVPFPAATCELGGGMATAYHRRPVISARDIAAVAQAKIGNGSAWQGYYMYAGGVNPASRLSNPDGSQLTLQESQATGYPNDMPSFDYDFAAPIGAAGRLHASHAELRLQHAFLAAFGQRLAVMSSSLPEVMPSGIADRSTPRAALRSDGDQGFLFLSWTQPHDQLEDLAGVSIAVELERDRIELPTFTLPAGTVARWPINLAVGEGRIRWATASVVTELADGTLVLIAEDGIPAMVQVGGLLVEPALGEITEIEGVRVLVLAADQRQRVWILNGELVLSDEPLWRRAERILTRTVVARSAVETYALTPASPVPTGYGSTANRASAPSAAQVAELGARWRLSGLQPTLPDGEARDPLRTLVIEWAGDVAQLVVDGLVVADRFWDGSPWQIDLDSQGVADEVELRILPLHRDAQVWLAEDAASRRAGGGEQLLALEKVQLEVSEVQDFVSSDGVGSASRA